MHKTLKSIGFALNGIKAVWKEERNFKIAVVASAVVTFCMFYFEFSYVEKVFCIIAMTMVLVAEMINTAIEDLCNKVNSHTDPMIAKIKDISSGFVLLTVLGAFCIGLIVFTHHFYLYY